MNKWKVNENEVCLICRNLFISEWISANFIYKVARLSTLCNINN